MNTESNAPSRAQIKQYRAIAHKLSPVVTVAGAGLSESVLAEIDRALNDHELIKLKVAVGDRDERDALIKQLTELCGTALIQRIGNTATILRRNPKADPRKSNLQRTL
ncbi:CRS1 / YhbY domain superfamily protein [Luminiphilus syltensis NOR5-1B]|uniref:CRS1 / YhbY domain superfamily protein n=1 Tax=Luminiphilus syltensis NOR5-1B TaxID=565045 RepID=B8KS09_9GAMM|nr:YhbY family RNA-binding protein [Luminiphilus syltensis]EED34870.1 CRS1 / YhbY domain superfamily protein [Luminiphilus syltensis NOR5-1B]